MGKPSAREQARLAALDALYAQLPTVACQGKCAIACGPIPLTDLEARRLQVVTHVKARTTADDRCIYLRNNRCSVYAVRPLLCRAWGVIKGLSCMHGCVPTSWLSGEEFVRIAQAIERLGGGRLLQTTPGGLACNPAETWSRFAGAERRSAADIAADEELTRSLRALHGGRITAAVRHDRD